MTSNPTRPSSSDSPFHRLSPDHSRWLTDTFARNRVLFAGFRMDASGAGDGGTGDGSGSGDGNTDGTDGKDGKGGNQDQTFTQADVDRIVAERLKRERTETRAKYADYDDLKAKAEGATALESRITELETKATQAELRAVRAEIASEFGISTRRGKKSDEHPDGEPSDADLFLTATDATAMRKQAERLAGRDSARKKNGNHSPREGQPPGQADDGNGEMREFTRGLFARANED